MCNKREQQFEENDEVFWLLASSLPGATNQVFNTIYFFFSFLPTIVTPRVAEVGLNVGVTEFNQDLEVSNDKMDKRPMFRQEVRKERPGEAAKWVTEAFSFAALMGLVGTVILAAWRFGGFILGQTCGYSGGVWLVWCCCSNIGRFT